MFTLICGLPNAGKTTYSAQFNNVLHLDDFPPSRFLNCNRAVAESDGDVVVEGIYNIRCRRELLLKGAKGLKVCIWIDTPLEVCLSRCSEGRPEHIVHTGARMFQPPTYSEGWDEIYIVKDGIETLMPREENYGGFN